MKTNQIYSIKRLIGTSVFALTLLFISTFASAQNKDTQPRFGVKGGLNLANLYINDVNNEQAKWGFHAGVWSKLPVGEFFAIQPEILWSSKGFQLGARYNHGLREIGKSDIAGQLTTNSKNAVAQVFVAFGF